MRIIEVEVTKKICADLRQAVKLLQDVVKDRSVLAGCLRLSIHDAFAYDSKKRVYGANASIRYKQFLLHTCTINE